jgi:hypothetical protein
VEGYCTCLGIKALALLYSACVDREAVRKCIYPHVSKGTSGIQGITGAQTGTPGVYTKHNRCVDRYLRCADRDYRCVDRYPRCVM